MEPAEQLVGEFLTEYRATGGYLREHVAQLAEFALSEDEAVAEGATRAVFTSLVEPLADSFEPDAVKLYNRAFAQVIQICRRDARAAALDDQLQKFGLLSEDDLIARAETLRIVSGLTVPRGSLRRVIVLSRVTLGADVAITSVIIERLKRDFPQADIVLVGGSKVAQLFGGDPRLSFAENSYRRTGATIARLLGWIDLLECVNDLTAGLKQGEYLIVDPDTRLTQLGLLPITPAAGQAQRGPASDQPYLAAAPQRDYLFFPSREYGCGTSRSLGELTSAWLDEVFGGSATTFPRLSLSREDIETARALIDRMKHRLRPIIAINFGVGENQLKRVGGDFEASLVARLIQDGNHIVLDKGAGEDEIGRADAVIARATQIERDGRRVRAVEIDEQSLVGATGFKVTDAEILVWNGGVGMLAALIAASNLYVGYDSAGQHIAAALGVPSIDVFAGFSSPRMIERWRPTGQAETRVLAVDSSRGDRASDVVEKVLGYASELLK
ncbi:MAG: glycosyltransferase family 9 protein [Acidobacteriota bacterium]